MFGRKKPLVHHETPSEKFVREHPYGEEGSPEYWQEVMKRAYELGWEPALKEGEKLQAMPAQTVLSFTDFPQPFWEIWCDRLSHYLRVEDHPRRMPY